MEQEANAREPDSKETALRVDTYHMCARTCEPTYTYGANNNRVKSRRKSYLDRDDLRQDCRDTRKEDECEALHQEGPLYGVDQRDLPHKRAFHFASNSDEVATISAKKDI